MGAIGMVSGTFEKGFVGEIRTLSIRARIEIRPNRGKDRGVQPDFRIWADDVDIGAGWLRVGRLSGETYVSLAFEAPEFGQRRLYANLGRAAGQDNPDCYAILWNPVD